MTRLTLDVEIVVGSARLAELEPAWWELFARVEGASPFQAPAWLIPWAECFANESALRTIVVTSGRGIIGLLPLVLAEEAGRVTARVLGHGISDYLDALIHPAARRDAPRALSEGLRRLAREVDVFELSDIPEGSPMLELQLALGKTTLAPAAVCPQIRLGTSFPEYVATLPRWLARNLRQGESRLARSGETQSVADGSSLGPALDAFFELHGARWRQRGEQGVLGETAVRRFHRLAAPGLLARGLLELHTSWVDERAIACAYVLVRRDAHLYLTGFDPAFERFSVGSIVIGRTIARAIDARRRSYDLLRGPEPYKYAWRAADTRTLRVTLETENRPSRAECRA